MSNAPLHQVRETAHTHVATEQAERRRVDSDLLLERAGAAATPSSGGARADAGTEGSGDETGGAASCPSVAEDASDVQKRWGHGESSSREERALSGAASGPPPPQDRVREFAAVFMETVFRNRSTAAVCAAGFAANLLTGAGSRERTSSPSQLRVQVAPALQ